MIKVLEGPLSTDILIAGQPLGTIRLEGRALPYRPIIFEGEQRLKTTWYPGNTVGTQQVLGPIEKPTTINGMWKDTFLGDDQARQLVVLFDTLRRSGSLVEMSWGQARRLGDLGPQGPEFKRRGILRRFKATFERPQDVAWEAEFEWNGQGETVSSPPLTAQLVNPREGFTEMRDTLLDTLDNSSAFFTRLAGKANQATFGQVNELLDIVEGTVDILDSAAAAPTSLAQAALATSERLVSISTKTVDTLGSLINTTLNVEAALAVAWDNAKASLDFLGDRLSTVGVISESQGTASDTADALNDSIQPEVIAEERPPAGSDLRDLAMKYYGDPDLWFLIAQFNNLFSSKVPSLPSGPSDNPGFPIAVPRRNINRIGTLEC